MAGVLNPLQAPRGASALRSGSLEIIMRPVNGWLSSRIRKIEADAESAKRPRAVMVVALLSANRLKLAKMMVSQEISTTRNGMGIDPPALANNSRRVFARSLLVSIALVWRERWVSFRGDSFWIAS